MLPGYNIVSQNLWHGMVLMNRMKRKTASMSIVQQNIENEVHSVHGIYAQNVRIYLCHGFLGVESVHESNGMLGIKSIPQCNYKLGVDLCSCCAYNLFMYWRDGHRIILCNVML